MIGSFSAASNISGILTDTEVVATLLHKYGAHAFFDYATAGNQCYSEVLSRKLLT